MKLNFNENFYMKETVACWVLLFCCCNMDFLTLAIKNSHSTRTELPLGNVVLQTLNLIFSIYVFIHWPSSKGLEDLFLQVKDRHRWSITNIILEGVVWDFAALGEEKYFQTGVVTSVLLKNISECNSSCPLQLVGNMPWCLNFWLVGCIMPWSLWLHICLRVSRH